MGKEVDKMVGEIIEGHKAQMLQNMKEHFGEGRADFFTTEDFVKMQKFGNNMILVVEHVKKFSEKPLKPGHVEVIPSNPETIGLEENRPISNLPTGLYSTGIRVGGNLKKYI
jgi:hypothetical protein